MIETLSRLEEEKAPKLKRRYQENKAEMLSNYIEMLYGDAGNGPGCLIILQPQDGSPLLVASNAHGVQKQALISDAIDLLMGELT